MKPIPVRAPAVRAATRPRAILRPPQRGLDPENVRVCFKETAWENWTFGGGRILHA
jgi:hypothetical protein